MVTLLLDSTRLEIELSAAERLLAFHKGNVQIERSSITKVQLTDDPWTWLRGIRAPGTSIPRVLAIGTWKSGGGDDFVVIRRRLAGVVIDLDAGEYRRIVLSTSHAHELVQALQLEVDDKPVDVVTLATGAIPVTTPSDQDAAEETAESDADASTDDEVADDEVIAPAEDVEAAPTDDEHESDAEAAPSVDAEDAPADDEEPADAEQEPDATSQRPPTRSR